MHTQANPDRKIIAEDPKFLRQEVSKRQPVGQIHPAACFHKALWEQSYTHSFPYYTGLLLCYSSTAE